MGVMVMYKAYKFRLYPTQEQKEKINKNFGCSRFVYNYYLSYMKENGVRNKFDNINDYVHHLQLEYPFLQEADSCVIRTTLFHLDDNFQRFFKSTFGYPKFKSKYDKNSYTTNAIYSSYNEKNYCNIEVDLKSKKIKLPKLKWVTMRGYRNLTEIKGKIINATISREKNGKYYVSVIYEVSIPVKMEMPTRIVGLDVGIKTLVTLSDGSIIENNKYLKKYEKRIKRLQRELSRKVKRSNNYYKCKNRLAVLYSKLTNARKYYLHRVTKMITDNYDIITTEKLRTQEMIKNSNSKTLTKNILDSTFREIIRQLEYKTRLKGKYFYQVDEYYPSSQICSYCGHKDESYKDIGKRVYKCKECNNQIDRDLNASINIAFEGVAKYMKEVYA